MNFRGLIKNSKHSYTNDNSDGVFVVGGSHVHDFLSNQIAQIGAVVNECTGADAHKGASLVILLAII